VTGEPTIVCAGTLARITCYNIRSLTLVGYGEPTASCTMLGNDAVIAARLLHSAGTPAACLLLGPSRDDVAVLQAEEPGLTVVTAGLRSGPVTASAVLQAADGSRYWLLPPHPTGNHSLPVPETATIPLVYADMYDEIEDAIVG
jgi:hypothetical protein